MWQRFKRFIKLRILHVSDSPHKIAMGVAIGIFVAWTPVIGPHMIMALALCALLRANKLVGVASVWVMQSVYLSALYTARAILWAGRWWVSGKARRCLLVPEVEDLLHKIELGRQYIYEFSSRGILARAV